ncbi:conserved hypothetical protein [Polaromonas naphthalenivorans CJ2]|uniref:DUF4124 domain-containing protein n=2 Tax=Polaromonas naphthalenivorans TaxID=216465 RepID=A1VNT3_POLNA|nr:conserved hypothetical protein [Polaromonas naphthalenivorans CJ2]
MHSSPACARLAGIQHKKCATRRYTFTMDFKFATRTLILAIAGSSLAMPALAQWQWIDKDGRKVFSDRAPPADILQKNILKQPGSKTPPPPSGTDTGATAPVPAVTASAAPAGKASAPKFSGKDAQLEARKKEAEDLETAKKQAEEEKMAKARADNCERAKKGQATLKSGVRIALTNAKGEREFMDDAARAAETKRLQAIAESDCGK